MTESANYQQFLVLHERPGGVRDVQRLGWGFGPDHEEGGFLHSGHLIGCAGRRTGSPIDVSGLPVNGDFVDGYGETPDDVAATVRAAIETGLAGIGVEDTSADPANPIRDFDDAVARVRRRSERS